ncbi:hypothetical protein LCGC14_1952130 [marine sediment metagenome]|uniref:Uncharacterized protein n=1 Tax=marine sediment metagenome TaxID=412755 RepID=A0A0F9HVI6_9ZZZZ
MAYRISKHDFENIADVLPDAYILDDNGNTIELVLQGVVDPQTANPIATIIDEEYRKEKRQQFINEVREVLSFKTSVKKRALCAIINDAVNSLHS